MAEGGTLWPYAALLRPGRYGAGQGEPPIRLAEARPGSVVEVGAWRDTAYRMGLVLPQLAPAAAILALAPGRWWVVEADPGCAARLGPSIGADFGTVTDLSDARAVLSVSGPTAVELMSRLLPLDMGDERLAPGRAAETVAGHIGVTAHRRETETFDLYVFRGFAGSFLHLVTLAAAPFGYRVDRAA